MACSSPRPTGLPDAALPGVNGRFFGIVMNANYVLASTMSTNQILVFLAIFIGLARRNAGWIGLDRWILPVLGDPWKPGHIFGRG